MSDIERSTIKRSILRKGFKFVAQSKYTGHDRYCLFYNGKWYKHIFVKISRGKQYRTYGITLQKKMKTALALDELSQVKDLFECPLKYDDYIEFLKRKDIIIN